MRGMSETPEPANPSPPVAPSLAPAPQSERLYQAAAWVAIIAGVTLIGVVFLKFAWVLGY
jgi:hypothetical protein